MIVLDASLALNIAFKTPAGRVLEQDVVNEHVFAPKFFMSEVGNGIWKENSFGEQVKDIDLVFENVCLLVDEFIDDEYLLSEALHEAVECRHSVYDMLYLVLARRNGAHLYTLDKRLQDLCWQKSVNCIQSVDLPSNA